jgi:hypothetical protein
MVGDGRDLDSRVKMLLTISQYRASFFLNWKLISRITEFGDEDCSEALIIFYIHEYNRRIY